jgi:hypothetical protein
MFKSGFIYKPTHKQVHFIRKDAEFNRRLGYEKKFTLDETEAKVYNDEFEAKKEIDFLMPPSKPNYEFTPITININTGEWKIHVPYNKA